MEEANGEIFTHEEAASVYQKSRQQETDYWKEVREPEKMSPEELQKTIVGGMRAAMEAQQALNAWEKIDPKKAEARKLLAKSNGVFESERAAATLGQGIRLLEGDTGVKDPEKIESDAIKYMSLGHRDTDVTATVGKVVGRYRDTHPAKM